jgi:pyrimidine deaminase RibD-like protein
MNAQKLELCILNVTARVETDRWLQCSIAELQNRMRAIDTDAANAPLAEIEQAVIFLAKEDYLSLRKWRNGVDCQPFDFKKRLDETYVGTFFYQDSFQLKLTHEGRKHLGETPGSTPANETEDHKFARLAIEEARKSIPEDDGRTHPLVGAVVVKDGKPLATAHRGEASGNHAEYIALEKRLADAAAAGSTLYTTLEPCTTRSHPKIPCVERIIERKIRRVVIGMLDPDPRIRGQGQIRLREANIITELFPHELMAQVEDLNREFTRQFKSRARSGSPVQEASIPAPKHNIRFVGAKSIQAHSGLEDGLIYESPQGLGDFPVSVVCFRNEPVVGQKVQQPTLKSQIIYKGKDGEEITDAPRGVWLGQYGEETVFESGKKKCLTIFRLSNQDTLMRLWNETYTSEYGWMADGPLFQIHHEGIPGEVASVEVRLLDDDTCVLHADFEVKKRRTKELPELLLRSLSLA